jgi:hypothetical protein
MGCPHFEVRLFNASSSFSNLKTKSVFCNICNIMNIVLHQQTYNFYFFLNFVFKPIFNFHTYTFTAKRQKSLKIKLLNLFSNTSNIVSSVIGNKKIFFCL